MQEINKHHIIVSAMTGSNVYGTSTETSDIDIFVLSSKNTSIQQEQNTDVWQISLSELSDHLLYDHKPKHRFPADYVEFIIINALFCDNKYILCSSDRWEKARENKDEFMSNFILDRIITKFQHIPTVKKFKKIAINIICMSIFLEYLKTGYITYSSYSKNEMIQIKTGQIDEESTHERYRKLYNDILSCDKSKLYNHDLEKFLKCLSN